MALKLEPWEGLMLMASSHWATVWACIVTLTIHVSIWFPFSCWAVFCCVAGPQCVYLLVYRLHWNYSEENQCRFENKRLWSFVSLRPEFHPGFLAPPFRPCSWSQAGFGLLKYFFFIWDVFATYFEKPMWIFKCLEFSRSGKSLKQWCQWKNLPRTCQIYFFCSYGTWAEYNVFPLVVRNYVHAKASWILIIWA